MNAGLTIRRAASLDDYRACQAAQRRAWGIGDESYVVPVATMVGAQLHGGLVLGAFLPSGEAIGMTFGFLGRIEDRLCLYSQLTGVVPGYQGLGIGMRLKIAQRDYARDEGLPLIAWAFDPLQAGNARFNLAKLGATAGRYIENMYGPRTDALNAGLPTDRLIAEWATEPQPRAVIGADECALLPRLFDPGPTLRAERLGVQSPRVLLEVPADINRLRADDPSQAERWRLAVRSAFQAAFAAGYRAVGFHRAEVGGYYLLEQEPAE